MQIRYIMFINFKMAINLILLLKSSFLGIPYLCFEPPNHIGSTKHWILSAMTTQLTYSPVSYRNMIVVSNTPTQIAAPLIEGIFIHEGNEFLQKNHFFFRIFLVVPRVCLAYGSYMAVTIAIMGTKSIFKWRKMVLFGRFWLFLLLFLLKSLLRNFLLKLFKGWVDGSVCKQPTVWTGGQEFRCWAHP